MDLDCSLVQTKKSNFPSGSQAPPISIPLPPITNTQFTEEEELIKSAQLIIRKRVVCDPSLLMAYYFKSPYLVLRGILNPQTF